MRMLINTFHISLFLAICLVLQFSSVAYSQDVPKNKTSYSFGVVPQFDARRIKTVWRPILDRVAKQAGVSFDLEGAPSIPDFEKAFESGVYDFAYMNPYHLIVANDTQGYLPLVRDYSNLLHGIIVVRKDSPIENVKQLDGKKVAFPAPNALGASLIPRAEFKRTFGITVVPEYVRSHTSVYLNVYLKQADAGGGVQKTLDQQKPELQEGLRILYQTVGIPPHPIAAHPRVPASVQQAVTQAFLDLGKSPEGRELLAKIPIDQIGATTLQDYELLKPMHLENFYVRK